MAKKALIAVFIFYLLGVFGVGIGYLSQNWADDWGAGDQMAEALLMGLTWPAVVVDLIVGA